MEQTRDVVVVGASAGGVEALRALVGSLPTDLPAAVLAVLHLPAGGTSSLPRILSRVGGLPAHSAEHGEQLEHGRVYVAPPDHHMLLEDDRVALSRGPAENGHRPAINALFRSAAVCCGARTTGVVLSGNLDDGAAGLAAITRRGGCALVQDPEEALYDSMPRAVLRLFRPQAVLPIGELGARVDKLVREAVDGAQDPPTDPTLENEVDIARHGHLPSRSATDKRGAETQYTCPDCGGTLLDTAGDGSWYRCHVGHGWTAEALQTAKGVALENALWTALRTLEEKADLTSRLLANANTLGQERVQSRYEQVYHETTEAAGMLRKLLTGSLGATVSPDDEGVSSGGQDPG